LQFFETDQILSIQEGVVEADNDKEIVQNVKYQLPEEISTSTVVVGVVLVGVVLVCIVGLLFLV